MIFDCFPSYWPSQVRSRSSCLPRPFLHFATCISTTIISIRTMASTARSACSLCKIPTTAGRAQGVLSASQLPEQSYELITAFIHEIVSTVSALQARPWLRMQSASSEASTSSTTSAADHVSSTPSTSASSSRSFSTDPKTRIVAAMILSRPPRQMSPLTNFEREYYKYARKVNRALGDRFNPDWYFRKGSQAEQAFKDLTGRFMSTAEEPVQSI